MDYDKSLARYAYDSFVLQQPAIQVTGMWAKGGRYFIVCPNLSNDSKTFDGKPLTEWFSQECRPITSPVELSKEIPQDAIEVPKRSVEELSLLHGEPLTISEVFREISSTLSKDFPVLGLGSPKGSLIVEVSREITSIERSELDIALSNFKLNFGYEVVVRSESSSSGVEPLYPFKGFDGLALTPARALSSILPKIVNDAYSEDEEFWVDNRFSVFSGDDARTNDPLSMSFRQNTSSCFIDATVFGPENIRVYLPAYHRVIIAMPLRERLSYVLDKLAVTKAEILELVSRGRVQFVTPQPIERYDLNFVASVLEAGEKSILLSRRLSVATLLETRSRIPFLYPIFGSGHREALLRLFNSMRDPTLGPVVGELSQTLGQIWVGMERNLSARGAMANMSHGVGPLISSVISHSIGKNVEIEAIFAAMSLEWSAALGATYFPVKTDDFSSYPFASLCASIYSGVRNQPRVNPIGDFGVFLSKLLTLDNDAPVLEVESVFTNRDINQISRLLNGITSESDRRELLAEINGKIKRFERHENRLKRLDFLSLGGAAAGVISGDAYIAFGAWVASYVLSNADPSLDVGGRALDWMRAINVGTSADVVMLSRVRNKIGKIDL